MLASRSAHHLTTIYGHSFDKIYIFLEQYKHQDAEVYVTIEEQEMFTSCYPQIVEQFQAKQDEKNYKKSRSLKGKFVFCLTCDIKECCVCH